MQKKIKEEKEKKKFEIVDITFADDQRDLEILIQLYSKYEDWQKNL
jgi:cytochrome oxidase Cu insertion factor (SCO1/SenC/PrrC family)